MFWLEKCIALLTQIFISRMLLRHWTMGVKIKLQTLSFCLYVGWVWFVIGLSGGNRNRKVIDLHAQPKLKLYSTTTKFTWPQSSAQSRHCSINWHELIVLVQYRNNTVYYYELIAANPTGDCGCYGHFSNYNTMACSAKHNNFTNIKHNLISSLPRRAGRERCGLRNNAF